MSNEQPVVPAPRLKCDIVLKGGVTSGVVYPRAIVEIAKSFRFVNIGGTSAGAIAATLTAAAEFRRQTSAQHDDFSGFALLDDLPTFLAGKARPGAKTNLAALFKPNDRTKPYFDFITELVGRGNMPQKFGTIFRALLGPLLGATLSGAAVGLVLGALALGTSHGVALIPALAAAILLAFAGGILAGAAAGILGFVQTFAKNDYGLCSGIADGDDGSDLTVLDAWLSRKIDDVAGVSRPLTFGDLWMGRPATTADPERFDDVTEPVIRFEAVTTCISHGRPYTFPTGTALLYFKPAELRRYLPGYVVDHMKATARNAATFRDAEGKIDDDAVLGMPPDRDLPIVFAARLSLAFPVLLCPTRLYAIDYLAKPQGVDSKGNPRHLPEACWFTDGGLSSNFPIHSFDAPLPRWPTFGINLGSFPDPSTYSKADQIKNVYIPSENGDGQRDRWTRFSGPLSYFSSMLDAIRGWQDNVTMRMPGYRDRIVTVMLKDDEGGLNLDMPADIINELAERGATAGRVLVDRFTAPSRAQFVSKTMDWENQRVVRYRVTMDALQRYLDALAIAYRSPGQPDDLSYEDLIHIAAGGTALPAYKWPQTGPTMGDSDPATRHLAETAEDWRRRGVDFHDGAPKPTCRLAIRGPF